MSPLRLAKGFALDIPKVEAASRRFSSAGTALPLSSPGPLPPKRAEAAAGAGAHCGRDVRAPRVAASLPKRSNLYRQAGKPVLHSWRGIADLGSEV